MQGVYEMNTITENTFRTACAFYFIIDELYQTIESPSDVNSTSVFNTFPSYLCVLFLALGHSDNNRRT
jgi:hypothetical protein